MSSPTDRIREALAQVGGPAGKSWAGDYFLVREEVIDAARRYADLLANGQRVAPDYEAAAQAIYDYGLPTATHDIRGRRVPFDRAMMTDSFRQAARAAVDAAIGDRLLSLYPKEAENE